jgi:hypothetical protein
VSPSKCRLLDVDQYTIAGREIAKLIAIDGTRASLTLQHLTVSTLAPITRTIKKTGASSILNSFACVNNREIIAAGIKKHTACG